MNKLNITGNYVFPQATLIQVANLMVENMYRDEQEFLKIGLTAEQFEEVKKLKEEFEAIPSDFRLKALVDESSVAVKELKKQLVQLIDELLLPIEFAYGKNSAAFNECGFASSKLKSSNATIVQTATDLYARLTTSGNYSEAILPKISIETLKLLKDSFSAEIVNYNALKTSKRNVTGLRLSKANELYKQVSRIAYFGKRLWMSKNIAYYNSYVLDNFAKTVKTKIEEVA